MKRKGNLSRGIELAAALVPNWWGPKFKAHATIEIVEPMKMSDKDDPEKFCLRMAVIKLTVPCYSQTVVTGMEGPLPAIMEELAKQMNRYLFQYPAETCAEPPK